MKVTQITARSKRTLPHPTRSFANFGADIELVAHLDEGDDEEKAIKDLQVRCEQLVEQHAADVRYALINGEEIRSTYDQLSQAKEAVQRLEEKIETKAKLLF